MNYLKNFSEFHNLIKKDKDLWDLFTKKEEYNLKKSDKYGRISYKTSNYKNILKPIVSEYLIKNGFHAEYENNKNFTIILSHDIDDIYFSSRQLFRSFIPLPLNKDKFGLVKFISSYIKKQKPYINFRKIIEIEKRYDATSTFFFLTSEKDIFGEKYKIEDLLEEIFFILDEGCEVGLHTSYYAFDNLNMIKTEKERLEKITGKSIVGVRNHLLRFHIPNSWETLAKAGFSYDSSLGYYDMLGFRNGMCHPFQPYNLDSKKKINIIELPLCIIDITLFSYMKKSAIESWHYIKKIIDNVEKYGGVLTILWHNWTFSYPVSYAGLFGKEWTDLYKKILEYCQFRKAWITTCEEVCKYAKKQGLSSR